MAVSYRNIQSGSVSTYASTIPRLEASEKWERVDDTPAVPAVSDGKATWVAKANELGLDVDGKNKSDVVDAVREALEDS